MANNIVRVEHNKDNPYLTINTTFLNDNNLSLKAKGLLGYFLSKPNNWTIMMHDLTNKHKDGRDSIYSAMRELRENGYMIKRVLKVNGKISEWESVIYETPQMDAIEIYKQQEERRKLKKAVDNVDDNPFTGNPYMEEKPLTGNQEVDENTINNQMPLTAFPDMEKSDTEIPYRVNPEIIINNNLLNNNSLNNEVESINPTPTTFTNILDIYNQHIKPLTTDEDINRLRNIYIQVSPNSLIKAIEQAQSINKSMGYVQLLAFKFEEEEK